MEQKLKDSGIPWIGQIPEHWETVPIKRITSYNDECWSENTLDEQVINYVEIADVNESSGITNITKYKFCNAPSRARRITRKNDIIISTVRTYLKAITKIDEDGLTVSTGFMVLRAKRINPSFLAFSVKAESFIQTIISLSVGISYPAINAIDVVNLKIPVPPLAEQEEIAAYLDKKCGEIDELIEVEQQMISDLESYRQSVITETVTHGLNPDTRMVESDCDWFASHPSHWRTEKIRNFFVKRTEKNNPIKTKERLSLSIDKGITLYADKTTNLDRFKDDFTQYQLAHPNDIVLNSMNMIVGAVGKSAYFDCVSPVYYVIYSKDANVNMDFYGYLLNTPIIRDVYHKLGQGIYAIERGDGRVNTCRLKVDYYEFSQIKVPVPPVEEQNTIVSFLKEKESEIDELIKVKQEKIETLKQYRQSLIFEAVTGKINISV